MKKIKLTIFWISQLWFFLNSYEGYAKFQSQAMDPEGAKPYGKDASGKVQNKYVNTQIPVERLKGLVAIFSGVRGAEFQASFLNLKGFYQLNIKPVQGDSDTVVVNPDFVRKLNLEDKYISLFEVDDHGQKFLLGKVKFSDILKLREESATGEQEIDIAQPLEQLAWLNQEGSSYHHNTWSDWNNWGNWGNWGDWSNW